VLWFAPLVRELARLFPEYCFNEACRNVSATVVPLHAFVFARAPHTVYPARMVKLETAAGSSFRRRCLPVVTRPVDQTAGAAA
jgi:hypothetical protein